MEGKKISFGFMKTKKLDKPLQPIIPEERREYIECVEEKSIKVVGGETVTEDEPLVIPMKPNTLITAERLQQIAEKVEAAIQEPDIKEEPLINEEKVDENETLDQMAVRELIQEAKVDVKVEAINDLAIPTPAKPVMTGEKESTLDDYESVPIQQFGMAMLRGMGWTPTKDGSKYKQPELRPKGLGLGADKVIKENQKKQPKDKKEEELVIVKNSFVKITTGKYSGYYGKVVSLDEDNGRVMVDIPVKKETVSLSEFMMHAVPKSEYDKESKVIIMEPRLRATHEQFIAIIDFMERHGDLSRPEPGPRGRLKVDRLWLKLTNVLNSLAGGVKKSPDKWKKVWADWKTKTKKKYLTSKQQTSGTGCPSSKLYLNALEERVAAVMGVARVVSQAVSPEQSVNRTQNESVLDSGSPIEVIELENVDEDVMLEDQSQNNADSYEEYKKKERISQKPKEEERSSTSQRNNDSSVKNERERDDYRRNRDEKSSNGRSKEQTKERRSSSSSEDRSRSKHKKDKKRYSSNDSLSSLSDDDRKRRKHKPKSRRHRSSSEESRKKSSEGKRDIDKKRKGKKKKRDRDRSPNYRKHRK